MVNYLSAECYKAFHRKYFYLFAGSCLALVAAFMFLLRVESRVAVDDMITLRVSAGDMMGIMIQGLVAGLYFSLIAADIVFSEQYKYNTLKNEVSFGLPRLQIYFGKLFSSILVAAVLCVVLLGGYLGLSCIFFPVNAELGETMRTFLSCVLLAFPLWLGGLGFYTMLQFSVKGTNAATIAYVMVVSILGSGFMDLMSMFMPALQPVARAMNTISLQTPFSLMMKQGPDGLIGYAWILGMSWLGISTVIGLLSFQRREIN